VWFNQYVSNQIEVSPELFCDKMHAMPDSVQIDSNVVMKDVMGRASMTIRQPLSLQIVNDPDMLQLVGREVNATEEGLNTTRPVFEIMLRITQVLKLQRLFAYHQSLVRVVVVTPTVSSITFSIQNPCTARGYTAPEFGAVSLKQIEQRERCMWTCRIDLLRQPYNSIPPTVEQLNESRPEYAVLDTKYACRALPQHWVAIYFGFEIHTHMIATSSEYTQILYDALDRMARAIETDFEKHDMEVIVALSVHNSIYHPVRFREQLQTHAEATCMLTQCENTWFPDIKGWTNQHFVYAEARRRPVRVDQHSELHGSGAGAHARRASVPATGLRRRTMGMHTLFVDGVMIGKTLEVLVEDADRLQVISYLRDSVYDMGEMMVLFSNTLQISSVEDFDIAGVVGFVAPNALPPPRNPPNKSTYWIPNYIVIIISISLIVSGVMVLVCVLCVREVIAKRRRRREEHEDFEDGL
jgi:hypothetical protein